MVWESRRQVDQPPLRSPLLAKAQVRLLQVEAEERKPKETLQTIIL